MRLNRFLDRPDLIAASTRALPAGVALIVTLAVAVAVQGLCPASANAADAVIYEVVSDQGDVPTANVEFNEAGQRRSLQHVALPWRLTVDVPDAVSPRDDGAEIRADWRPYRWRYKYVTVRIYVGDRLLCESTLDVGDATCYGSVPHRNFPGTGGG